MAPANWPAPPRFYSPARFELMRASNKRSSDLGNRRRHARDRLQDDRSDLVGVALGVRAAIFEIAAVAVVDEAVRNANGGAAVGHAVAELVPRRRLVLAGQAQVVVR